MLAFSWVTVEVSANVFVVVSSLPELLEKKRLVDMHTNVATAILEQIKVTPLLSCHWWFVYVWCGNIAFSDLQGYSALTYLNLNVLIFNILP